MKDLHVIPHTFVARWTDAYLRATVEGNRLGFGIELHRGWVRLLCGAWHVCWHWR